MGIFHFDIEGSFNSPNFGRSYVFDVSNEQVQKLMNYAPRAQAMTAHYHSRISERQTVRGEVIAELTFDNVAWSYLCGAAFGERLEISGYEFAPANNSWGVLAGTLTNALSIDSTTFQITAEDSTAFDGVDAVIINDEMIEIGSISANLTLSCVRGAQGTTPRAHAASDAIWGLSAAISRSIVMCHRVKTGPFCHLPTSLTTVIDRGNEIDAYSGVKIQEMTFNFRPGEVIKTHIKFLGADSTNNVGLEDLETVDDNDMVGVGDIQIFSNFEHEYLEQFYITIGNELEAPSFMFSGRAQNYFLKSTSTYGTLAWLDDDPDHVRQYEEDDRRHFGIVIPRGNYKMIFNFNNVRINTPSHFLDDDLIIDDISPWYSYEHPVIMFQF